MATVEAAIADGKARNGVRDLAGWVVSLLRTHRDYGWKIAPPPPRPDSPEALRAAFARYAVEQETERRVELPDNQPWFPPPAPLSLDAPGGLVRLWNEVQAAIKVQIPRAEFDAWIRRVTLLGVERGVATIMAPNVTVKSALEDCYLGQLRELLTMYVGEALEVRVILNPSAPAQGTRPAPPATSAEPTVLPEPAERPDWIAAERWAALPSMLRAALIGSALVDGELQIASPYLDRLLRTRYAREVGELLAAP